MAKKKKFSTSSKPAKAESALGIPGLKKIMNGQEITANTILITGVPGTGKTIFILQSLYNAALDGKKSLFITYEESPEMIRKHAKAIGFDKFEELEKKGMITIIEQNAGRGKITSLANPMTSIIKGKYSFITLDSLTLFEYIYPKDELSLRKGIIDFLNTMRKNNITFVSTAERKGSGIDNFHHEQEDFLFDGLIVLLRIRKGSSFERILTVLKMRGHSYSMNLFPFNIKTNGITVFPDEIPFSLIGKEE